MYRVHLVRLKLLAGGIAYPHRIIAAADSGMIGGHADAG
jgi:hypothetical protein